MYNNNELKKYTITEGLQELKLLTKRINRLIEQTKFVTVRRSEDKNFIDINDTPSNVQSIEDLIKRRAQIKSVIMQSNAVTKVEIANKTYTVSEVIAHKEFIKEQENYLEAMRYQYTIAQEEILRYNTERQRKIDTLLQTTFGRDSANKTSVDDIKNITDTYMKQYNIELIDPLKIKEKIDKLQNEIDEFKNTCDFKLSYINAVTIIEV